MIGGVIRGNCGWLFLALAVVVAGSEALTVTAGSYADALRPLQGRLPSEMDGWKAEPEDHFYDPETIFSYINGSGEVYRAYNMKACLSRRYVNDKGEGIVLDLFHMGSSQDAFGVFTPERAGTLQQIGQGGLYRKGWLRWWKGSFFASLQAERSTEGSEKAMVALGRKVESLIQESGALPSILALLPHEGLDEKANRYLHHPVILNYHYYIANENILLMDQDTDAALAAYERRGEKALLLLILYPTRERAQEAHSLFRRHYLSDAKTADPILLENKKWCGAALKHRLLAVVLEAQTLGLARDLLLESGEKYGSD